MNKAQLQEHADELQGIVDHQKKELELWRNLHTVTFMDSGGKIVTLPFRSKYTAEKTALNLRKHYPDHHIAGAGIRVDMEAP